jgi:hypothetical protein
MKLSHSSFALLAALLAMVPVASADWSDNFDSYTLGGITGQGGWSPWEGNPAAEAYVVNTYSHSASQSIQITPTTDIVQEFSETSGSWVMTAWQYIPAGSTGKQYFIMLNTYTVGGPYDWSTQLEFDSDLGLMTVYSGTGAAYIVEGQWVEVKVEINLDACTQSIYYNGVLIDTIPWQTTGVNELNALDLFSDGGSAIYWDDCSLVQVTGLTPTTWGEIKTLLQ